MLVCFAIGVAALRTEPPAPLAAGAPPGTFSAARADAVLRRLLDGVGPHPVGSPADAEVRARLVLELRRLGLEAELQPGFACSAYGTCAEVVNVLAVVAGARPGRAVALVSHHDSVGAGPGASDDGAGVAVALETARALLAGPPLPRPVFLLFTDGEEAGLLGSRAFLEHPRAREVAAIVNLEARGTSGRSLLFEVKSAPALVARAARALRRPATSSLFAAVYERLPNDTDLTVLAGLGVPGLNLAFIGDVTRYHTPLDDLAHVDPGTLQHHGDNALSLVRTLAAAPDLGEPPTRPTVWFDVLSLGIVAWPERTTLPLALATLALAALATVGARARGARWTALAWAGLAPLAAALTAAGVTSAVRLALGRAGALPFAFVAHPGPLAGAAWLLGGAAALGASASLPRRTGRPAALSGVALALAMLGVALAVVLPGASYLLLVPAAAATLAAAVAQPWPHLARGTSLAALPALVAAALLAPVALQLPAALGVPAVAATGALASLMLATLAPLVLALSRRARAAAVLLPVTGALVLAAAQLAEPAFTPDAPRRLPILHHEDANHGTSSCLVPADGGALPPELAAIAPFRRVTAPPISWTLRSAYETTVPGMGAPPPQAEILEARQEAGRRVVRVRLRSPRGAPTLALVFPAGPQLLAATVDGHPVAWASKARRLVAGRRWVAVLGALPRGVEVELVLSGPVEATLLDSSPGLPPGDARLAAARPGWATTSQDGDASVVSRVVRW